jgi:F-type H+-transporting ATPase subunit b
VPQLDVATFAPQIIWLAITFLLLYVLMAKVALPRVAEVLEERTKRIEGNLEKADALKREAEAARDAYEKAIAESRAKAGTLTSQAADRAAKEAAERQHALAATLAEQARDTEQKIAAARAKALESTHSIAADVAREAVRKLLGRDVDSTAVDAAVKSVVAKAR